MMLGHLDHLTPRSLSGWARHDMRSIRPVPLLVTVDGQFAGRVLANAYRADVAAAGHGFGQHGFTLESPLLTPGALVEIMRDPDGESLPGGPFVVPA